MINKKVGVLIFLSFYIISFLSFNLNFVSSQDLTGIGEGLEGQVSGLEDNVNTIKTNIEEERWNYIGQELKTILLKNPVIAWFDSLFKKIDFVFLFLFGEHYDLSLLLFFAIILWFFFFYTFHVIFRDYSAFSNNIAMIIAFAIAVASAQIGVYKKSSELIFKLIFYREGIWGWIASIIFVVVLITLFIFVKRFGGIMKMRRELKEKDMEKLNRKILGRQVKSLSKIGE